MYKVIKIDNGFISRIAIGITLLLLLVGIADATGGGVLAWGYNENGQLGDGTRNQSYTPVQVSGLTGAINISASNVYASGHVLALKSDRTVWAWGRGGMGAWGMGSAWRRYIR
jgi:alpha-tubulin suppressor-like RCC1 family protein